MLKFAPVVGPSVTVITVSAGRWKTLGRAARSVATQDYAGPVQHVLVLDSTQTGLAPSEISKQFGTSVYQSDMLGAGLPTVLRLARLRNWALQFADGDLVAFLDDDNFWAKSHLSLLVASIRRMRAEVGHSHRLLKSPDGSPYLKREFPWGPTERERISTYRAAVRCGVMSPGSAVLASRLDVSDPRFRFIDMGELLFCRAIAVEHGIPESFDGAESGVGEDDAWVERLVASGLPIVCSREPTLMYTLGGISQSF